MTSILTIALVLTHIFPAFAIERATYQKVGRESANVMNGSTLLK